MLPNADDGQKRIKKYFLENPDTPEANTIPKEKPKEKEEKFDENDPYNNKETLTNTVDSDDSEW